MEVVGRLQLWLVPALTEIDSTENTGGASYRDELQASLYL